MEIGERLKETREELDMSLDTLQEKTKIQKRYLMAIENGDFHVLPGSFYARAFIKEYAIAVGLDPNELLDQYQGEIPSVETETTEPYTRMQRSRKINEPRNTAVFSFIPTVIVVLLVIGILFVAWTLYQKSTNSDEPGDSDEPSSDSIIRNPGDTNDNDETEDGDKDTEEDSADEEDSDGESDDEENDETETEEHTWEVTEEGSGSRPESTLLFTSGTDDVEVTIETSEADTWLSVKDEENNVSIDQMLTTENSPLEIDASDTKRLYINIGNAATTTVSINGEEMEFPVDPKQYVVQTLWIDIEKAEE